METLIIEGWSVEEVPLDKKLMSYVRNHLRLNQNPTRLICSASIEEGQKVILVRDPKGIRRAVYCSIPCQRKGMLELVARRRFQYHLK